MKKVLSRILAIAFALVLFSAPVTTQAATIESVTDYGTFKLFKYSPNDLLIINQMETGTLHNNEYDGVWYVEAGHQFWTNIHLIMPASFRVMLYDASTGSMISSQEFSNESGVGPDFYITKTGIYRIIIQAYTPTIVDFYVIGIN